MVSKQELQHIARLARLKFEETDLKKYQKQISVIFNYISELKKVKTKNIPPSISGAEIKNVLREDKVEDNDKEMRERLLKASPLRDNDLIKTKGIFEKK